MKGFLIVAIIVTGVICINTNAIENTEADCTDAENVGIFEDKIREAIEKLRVQLKEHGLPDYGFSSLDPLDFNNRDFTINSSNFNLNLNLSGEVTGVLDFNITALTFQLIGMKFNFSILFPNIHAELDYGLMLTSPAFSSVYGNGHFQMNADNFTIDGFGNMKSERDDNGTAHILVDKTQIDLNLGGFFLNITGLYNDDDISEMISEGLTASMPDLLHDLHDDINAELRALIDILNAYLMTHPIPIPDAESQPFLIQCQEKSTNL